jgi:hypothetical protein
MSHTGLICFIGTKVSHTGPINSIEFWKMSYNKDDKFYRSQDVEGLIILLKPLSHTGLIISIKTEMRHKGQSKFT